MGAESFEEERRGSAAQIEQVAVAGLGNDGGQSLPPLIRDRCTLVGQLAVQRSVGPVDVQQGLGDRRRQPRPVDGQRFARGEAQPGQHDQWRVLVELEMGCCHRILDLLELEYPARLLDTGGFDRLEQAVEGAEHLLELGAVDDGSSAPHPLEDAGSVQVADRLSNGVPADVVVLGQ